jgi:hypothetical protein
LQIVPINRGTRFEAYTVGICGSDIEADENSFAVAVVEKEMLRALRNQLAMSGAHVCALGTDAGDAAASQANQRLVGIAVGLTSAGAAWRDRQVIGKPGVNLGDIGE